MQNFLSGRKKISSEKIPQDAFKVSEENLNLSKVEVVNSQPGQPKVELVTENGVIKNIIITCKCGERIELKCHY